MDLRENNLNNVSESNEELRISKRGSDPDDDKWFSKNEIAKLKIAQEEVQWLLSRGYNMSSIIQLIGGHYQFSTRQRMALQRATASFESCKNRKEKLLSNYRVKDDTIYIDGFNFIITLEVALSGGILILGNDGTIRDLAGLRGTYKLIDKTEKALEIIGNLFTELKVPQLKFFLDMPVSNSGRLKTKILEHSKVWNIPTEVELHPNPDKVLCKMERVVSTDSVILDNCFSWFNFFQKAIDDYITNANIINLSGL